MAKECEECGNTGTFDGDVEYIKEHDMWLCNDCLDEYLGASCPVE